MATKSALIALLVAAALGCAVAQAPPFFRYVSVTQYNRTANVTQIAEWEFANLKNCSKTFLGARVGINVNYLPKANWGQYVKVIDFANTSSYSSYKTCDDGFARKALINSYVVGKAHAFVAARTGNKRVNDLPDTAYFHVGLSNVTNTTAVVTLRTTLNQQFAGASVLDTLPGVFNPASPVVPSNNHNHANIIITNVQNTLLAYYHFKTGNNGTVLMLPVYSSIKTLQGTGGGRDTEFPGRKVV